MKTFENVTVTTRVHPDGTITEDKVVSSSKIEVSREPEYIKLYTKMWMTFMGIEGIDRYVKLFLSLAKRMSFCNSNDMEHSQIVFTCEPNASAIMQECGWKRNAYMKGLQALCAAGCIRRIGRSVYQINPSYIGKGEWRYNPKLRQGGIRDLVAVFKFKDSKVKTEITWADDGEDTEINKDMRKGVGVDEYQRTVMTDTVIKPKEEKGSSLKDVLYGG